MYNINFRNFFQDKKVSKFLYRLRDAIIKKESFSNGLYYYFIKYRSSDSSHWKFFERFSSCGKWLKGDFVSGLQGIKKKITAANFCNYYKFCPICSTRYRFKFLKRWRSRVDSNKKFQNMYWYFKTVTVPHKKEDDLELLKKNIDLLCTQILKKKNHFWEYVFKKYNINPELYESFELSDKLKLYDLGIYSSSDFNKLLRCKDLYYRLKDFGLKGRIFGYFKFFKKVNFKFNPDEKIDLYVKYRLIDFNSLCLSLYLKSYNYVFVDPEKEKGFNLEYYLIGGVTSFEVTYSEKNGFHPHYHELCYSYRKINFPKSKTNVGTKIYESADNLKELCAEILGIENGPHVKITKVKDQKQKLYETIKYLSKYNSLNGKVFVKVYESFKDFRTLRSYGGLYGISEGVIDDEEVNEDHSKTFSLESVEDSEKVLKSIYLSYGKSIDNTLIYHSSGWAIDKKTFSINSS